MIELMKGTNPLEEIFIASKLKAISYLAHLDFMGMSQNGREHDLCHGMSHFPGFFSLSAIDSSGIFGIWNFFGPNWQLLLFGGD